jgi:hypothetical protein
MDVAQKKKKPADVADVLRAFREKGPRAVCASSTLFVNGVELRLNKPVLLKALESWELFHPEDEELVEEMRERVTLFKRRGRFGIRTLTIAWRGSNFRDIRPVLQVPITLYAEALDISPPEAREGGGRARSEHTLFVEFLKDRIIIHTDRLSTDAPFVEEDSEES